MLLPLIFATVMGVIKEYARKGLMNEFLYADDLVLMSESMENLERRSFKMLRGI